MLRGPKTPADTDAEGEFVANESEVRSELVDSQPFAPATGIPDPLESDSDAERGSVRTVRPR